MFILQFIQVEIVCDWIMASCSRLLVKFGLVNDRVDKIWLRVYIYSLILPKINLIQLNQTYF